MRKHGLAAQRRRELVERFVYAQMWYARQKRRDEELTCWKSVPAADPDQPIVFFTLPSAFTVVNDCLRLPELPLW